MKQKTYLRVPLLFFVCFICMPKINGLNSSGSYAKMIAPITLSAKDWPMASSCSPIYEIWSTHYCIVENISKWVLNKLEYRPNKRTRAVLFYSFFKVVQASFVVTHLFVIFAADYFKLRFILARALLSKSWLALLDDSTQHPRPASITKYLI